MGEGRGWQHAAQGYPPRRVSPSLSLAQQWEEEKGRQKKKEEEGRCGCLRRAGWQAGRGHQQPHESLPPAPQWEAERTRWMREEEERRSRCVKGAARGRGQARARWQVGRRGREKRAR